MESAEMQWEDEGGAPIVEPEAPSVEQMITQPVSYPCDYGHCGEKATVLLVSLFRDGDLPEHANHRRIFDRRPMCLEHAMDYLLNIGFGEKYEFMIGRLS